MNYVGKMVILVAFLTTLIIGSGIYVQKHLISDSKNMETQIDSIKNSIIAENWEEADDMVFVLGQEWSRIQNIWEILLDHSEIDLIDDTMVRFTEFVKTKQQGFALVEASALKEYIKHIPAKEAFKFGNIL